MITAELAVPEQRRAEVEIYVNSCGPAPETGDLVLAPEPRVPPLPLERIRQLTDRQCRDALIFLSGYRPAECELAIAAAMTPLSRMGTAR